MVESKARWKRLIAFMLAFAMVFSSIAVSSFSTVTVQAASKNVKKVTLKSAAKDVTKKKINVYSGSKKTLKVLISPKGAKKNVTFKSSKPSVASVTKKGVITGRKKGTAKINVTVTGKDNKKTKTYVNVNVKYVKLTLNKKNASVNAGKSITLKAASTPKKTVKWSSSDKTVATVSSKGVVKGVKAGTAVITAKVGQKKATCKVTVKGKAEVAVTGVQASIESSEISVGNGTQIVANVLPANAANKKLTYSSDNPAVATVTETGAVIGIGEGTANITVRSENGKTAKVQVTVKYVKVTGITVSPNEVKLGIDSVANLTAAVSPENASEKQVTWSSDSAAIASVDENGKVTGVAEGTVTITATAKDGSGITGTCKVTVEKHDGMTVSLLNPYKEAKGNTVLYGDNMHIAVDLKDGDVPVKGENVTLRLQKKASETGNNMSNRYSVRSDYAVRTNDDGRAEFVIGLNAEYEKEGANPMNGEAEVYRIIATRTRANDNTNVNQKELIVNTATIKSEGIKVIEDTNDPPQRTLEASDNADGWWNTIHSTRAIGKTTASQNKQEYVVSQKVNPKSGATASHNVEFAVSANLMYGEKTEEVRQDWEWPRDASETASGNSGSYSVYNKADDETTRTVIKDIPAGVKSLRVNFKKIDLSDFTKVYIGLYDSVRKNSAGKPICLHSAEFTNTSNLIVTDSGKELTHQIPNIESSTNKLYLVVSVITEGQVKVSESGYILSRIIGAFASGNEKKVDKHSLDSEGLVKWEDVSNEVTYEKTIVSDKTKIMRYLPTGVGQSGYTYELRIPAFPYSGNAFITVKNGSSVVGVYAYPAQNRGDNVNELAGWSEKNANPSPKAIRVTNNEANNRCPGFTQSGNHAIAGSELTGMTALKATINIPGVEESIFNSQNGKVLYTSVQWAPYSQEQASGNDDFYSVEGQAVKIVAQLCDINGNPATQSGETINFTANNADLANGSRVGRVVLNTEDSQVALAADIPVVTDSDGKVVLQLRGNGTSYIENLTARAQNSKFNVRLSIVSSTGNIAIPNNKADIYWVDLGLSYTHSAKEPEKIYTNYENREIGHISDPSVPSDDLDFSNGACRYDDVLNPESKFERLTDWRIGYRPLARVHANGRMKDNKIEVNEDSIKINYSLSSNSIDVSGANESKYLISKDKNVAVMHSDEIGRIRLTGKIGASDAELKNVVFTYSNNKNVSVTKPNVGTGTSNEISNTAITHSMHWRGIGTYVDFVTEKGTVFEGGKAPELYVKVRDRDDKRYGGETVQIYEIVKAGAPISEGIVFSGTTAMKDGGKNEPHVKKGCVYITDAINEAITSAGEYYVNVKCGSLTNSLRLTVTKDKTPAIPDADENVSGNAVSTQENIVVEQPNAGLVADENPNIAEQ